jgi:hypothetical protein
MRYRDHKMVPEFNIADIYFFLLHPYACVFTPAGADTSRSASLLRQDRILSTDSLTEQTFSVKQKLSGLIVSLFRRQ